MIFNLSAGKFSSSYGDFTLPGQVPHAMAPMSVPAKRNNHKTNHRWTFLNITSVKILSNFLLNHRDRIYRRLQKKETSENTLFNKYNGGSGLGNSIKIL